MIIIRILILIALINYSYQINNFLKNNIMKRMSSFFIKIKYTLVRFYRIIKVKKLSEFVWKALIKLNQDKGWRFGQYETEKRIENSFLIDKNNSITFYFTVTSYKLEFSALILKSFDEDKTNDLLVLASPATARIL